MDQIATPHPDLIAIAPMDQGPRMVLFAVRRMAVFGINDAHVANALLGAFGRSYRRPLILLRAMMLELARSSQRSITVAPCCCPRLTQDENRLMHALGTANVDTRVAHTTLTEMLDSAEALGPLTCAQAVAQSFGDLGQPLTFRST